MTSRTREHDGRVSVTSLSRHPNENNEAAMRPMYPHAHEHTVNHDDGSSFSPHAILENVERRISLTTSPEYHRLPKTTGDPREFYSPTALDVPSPYDLEHDGDSLDEDVADSDDVEARRVCCGEARLNWDRFSTEMVKQGRRMKKKSSRMNIRSYCRSIFSLQTLKRRVPILEWGPKYSLTDLQGDLVAGTTVGMTVLPQAIAYTAIAGVRAEFGLYSSYISSIIYTFFGPSKDITLGPSAISSLMTVTYASAPVAKNATVAILAAFLCGFIYLGASILGLGFFIEFVPLSVMKSFVAASAITIAMSQVKRWWGLVGVPGDFMPQLYWTFNKLPQSRLWDFLLGLCCICIVITLKQLKTIPWKRKYEDLPIRLKIVHRLQFYFGIGRNIVAISLATLVTYIFYANGSMPFKLTGYIPPGIRPWQIPNTTLYDPSTNVTYSLSDLSNVIGIGFIIIPVLGMLECMAIGGVFARRGGYRMDPNQELFVHGLGNIFTGLAGGYPVAGTFSRTALNAQSGSRTPAGGLVTGVIVLIAIQFLCPVFFYIPDASIACVIVLAVIDMISFQKIWIFWKTRQIDILPWIVTFVLSFVISIAWGVIIGIGFSIILLVYPSARPKIKVLRQDATPNVGSTAAGMKDSIMLITFNTGLLYPAVEYLKDKIIPIYKADERPKGIVFDFAHVNVVDTTTVMGMRDLLENCEKKKIRLVVCNLQEYVDKVFTKAKMKFYLRAENVAAAVKLINDLSAPSGIKTDSVVKEVIRVHSPTNNEAYANMALDISDEVESTKPKQSALNHTKNT